MTVQMCTLLFSWKFIQVSCPVLIGAAVFCPLWSNKTLRCGDSRGESACGATAPTPELCPHPSGTASAVQLCRYLGLTEYL